MEYFKNIYRNWQKRSKERRRMRIEARADMIFGIEMYEGKLWYTCNDILFCPCSFACGGNTHEDIVETLSLLRKMYVERTEK